jgi:hypothetical protein
MLFVCRVCNGLLTGQRYACEPCATVACWQCISGDAAALVLRAQRDAATATQPSATNSWLPDKNKTTAAGEPLPKKLFGAATAATVIRPTKTPSHAVGTKSSWTPVEELFMDLGLRIFGTDACAVSRYIGSKTCEEVYAAFAAKDLLAAKAALEAAAAAAAEAAAALAATGSSAATGATALHHKGHGKAKRKVRPNQLQGQHRTLARGLLLFLLLLLLFFSSSIVDLFLQ